jgi:hypothetical protein
MDSEKVGAPNGQLSQQLVGVGLVILDPSAELYAGERVGGAMLHSLDQLFNAVGSPHKGRAQAGIEDQVDRAAALNIVLGEWQQREKERPRAANVNVDKIDVKLAVDEFAHARHFVHFVAADLHSKNVLGRVSPQQRPLALLTLRVTKCKCKRDEGEKKRGETLGE